jgi:predicted nucleotidyltransferase
MISSVKEKSREIKRLCVKYRVKRLELFGSATGDDFNPQTSDMDFLVEFLPLKAGEYADAYFGLLEALQELFNRPVDLVMTEAVKNQYFLESINRTREVLYAA